MSLKRGLPEPVSRALLPRRRDVGNRIPQRHPPSLPSPPPRLPSKASQDPGPCCQSPRRTVPPRCRPAGTKFGRSLTADEAETDALCAIAARCNANEAACPAPRDQHAPNRRTCPPSTAVDRHLHRGVVRCPIRAPVTARPAVDEDICAATVGCSAPCTGPTVLLAPGRDRWRPARTSGGAGYDDGRVLRRPLRWATEPSPAAESVLARHVTIEEFKAAVCQRALAQRPRGALTGVLLKITADGSPSRLGAFKGPHEPRAFKNPAHRYPARW